MMKIVQNCYQEKVCDVLNEMKEGKALILFNHGLGDYVLFLPIFEELKKRYPDWELKLGFSADRNYTYIHSDGLVIEPPYGKYNDNFDVIFGIQYPDPPRTKEMYEFFQKKFNIPVIEQLSKPYLCNLLEIGMEDFEWKPYNLFYRHYNLNSKRVGVHFFGYSKGRDKNLTLETAKAVWEEIIEIGLNPFEIQMISPDQINIIDQPDWIDANHTIRNQFPNVRIMAEEIRRCKYFIGVDSGPIYLAGSIIGFENCIGLERLRKFDKVLPYDILQVDVEDYEYGSIFDILDKLEDK